MTLKEFKQNVLKMIEEISSNPETYTDDPDIDTKLNTVINKVLFEIARMKKLPAISTQEIETELDLKSLDGFYQVDHIYCTNEDNSFVGYDLFGTTISVNEPCTAKIFYYKYPKSIDNETIDEEYEFDLDKEVVEILLDGVAGDLLKSDVSASYGQIYSQRYELELQRLDSRYSQSSIYIEENEVI